MYHRGITQLAFSLFSLSPDKKYIWDEIRYIICLTVGQNMKKRLITFKVTDAMISWMNDMMSAGNYNSRSELVRDALAEFLAREYYDGEIPRNSKIKEREPLNSHR